MPLNIFSPIFEDIFTDLFIDLFADLETDLMFHSDFNIKLNAVESLGSPIADFSSARSSSEPATYIDNDGVMQVTTTADIPRFTYKYYDSTGLQDYYKRGLIIENQMTNYLTRSIFDTDSGSGLATGWAKFGTINDARLTYSLIDIKSLFNIGTNVNAQRIQILGDTGDSGEDFLFGSNLTGVGTFSQNDDVTASVFIKGGFTGISSIKFRLVEFTDAAAFIAGYNSSDMKASLLPNNFIRIDFQHTIVNATTGRLQLGLLVEGIDDGDSADIQIANFQCEKSKYMTSFIPTTSSSLTRNAEILKFNTLDNRNSVESSVIIFSPLFNNTQTSDNYIIDTDTKRRLAFFVSGGISIFTFANFTDSVDCNISDIINSSFNANDVMTFGLNIQHESPYMAAFYSGVTSGTNETVDDFIDPAWGTDFYVGCRDNETSQLDGVFFDIYFFNRILSDAEHASFDPITYCFLMDVNSNNIQNSNGLNIIVKEN